MFLRSAYNYDADIASFKSGLDCSDDPSRAQQHMRDETDINMMVQRFQRTNTMPPQAPPEHAVFEGIFDFQTAQNAVIEGRNAFMSLPARVRERYHNSPAEFLVAFNDVANRDEMVALGVLQAVPDPVVPAAVSPAPEAS